MSLPKVVLVVALAMKAENFSSVGVGNEDPPDLGQVLEDVKVA